MKPMTEATPIVEMRNIKKSFAAVRALRGVDLVLHHNEVLGLVGDNAAGKSTLMKVLSGAYLPDEGEIFIEGKKALMGRKPLKPQFSVDKLPKKHHVILSLLMFRNNVNMFC